MDDGGLVIIWVYVSLSSSKSMQSSAQDYRWGLEDASLQSAQIGSPVGKKISKYPCLTKKVSHGTILPPYLV